MNEKRKGRQEPTVRHTLPYTKSEGASAVEIYEKSGREVFPWQKNVIYDMLAVDEDGLWVHSAFGYSVPRQNGKNEVIAMRELYGLTHGERILHTAHRTATSRAAWERLIMLLEKAGIREIKGDNHTGYKSGKSKGQEWIELDDDNGGGRVWFRTRSTTGGLGETFDLLIIDEAQEYQKDQESALKYTIVSSDNPQTIYLGTPPTPYSAGTIFPEYRRKVLAGEKKHAGWEEWSVESECDPENVDAWYESNPTLGFKLTERAIEDEIGEDKIDFNIQRLGLWIAYNQQSAISKKEWERLQVDALPKLNGYIAIGIKFNKDGLSVSLAVAVKTSDDKIFTEVIGCKSIREGIGWIIDFISATQKSSKKIIVDGANGIPLLEEEMKARKLKNLHKITVGEYIEANSKFEQSLFNKTLTHAVQPAVEQIVSNCDKRAIGSGGGWGYKSIKLGVDVSIMDSMILAIWGLNAFQDPKKVQQVRY